MKYLLTLALLMTACAKTSTETTTIPADAARAAMPYQSSSPWWAFNLNVNDTNLQVVHWVLAYDQQCDSAVVLNNGVMTVALSQQTSAPSANDFTPGCSYFNGNWTYSVTNGKLTICQTNEPCVTFN